MKKNSDDYYNKTIDNELKKKELKDKYGGRFNEPNELPPDVEKDWLNHMEEFEKQFENAESNTCCVTPAWQVIEKKHAGVFN